MKYRRKPKQEEFPSIRALMIATVFAGLVNLGLVFFLISSTLPASH